MNATRRHAGEGGVGRATSDAAVRGALLIGVAVVIGLLLLWRAHDDPSTASGTITSPTEAPAGDGATDPTTPAGDGATTLPPGATTTALPPTPSTHVPNQVPVLVANGSGTTKGASTVTNKLIPIGYDTKPAADADQTYEKSKIFYREGFAEDAKQIARTLGVPEPVESIIEAMPATPPVMGAKVTANAQAAQVLVLLGTDQVIKQT
jgi:hypothetical protein